jgi:hypothetical protein
VSHGSIKAGRELSRIVYNEPEVIRRCILMNMALNTHRVRGHKDR